MLKKELLISLLIILIYSISCNLIYNNSNTKEVTTIKNNNQIKISSGNKNEVTNEIIGKIIIKKINIKNNLYEKESIHNNVDKNITILNNSIEPTKDNSIMFIAAHSGTGKLAYFKDLDKLEINDEIILIYKNKEYKYEVKEIWEEDKNGYIHVKKEKKKQLILTTCSPTKNNKQLIINCTIKDSI